MPAASATNDTLRNHKFSPRDERNSHPPTRLPLPTSPRTAVTGLRSPHKLKSAVSGCVRECAEAQGKDFGMVATENGYNLYVCGNGGAVARSVASLGWLKLVWTVTQAGG